GPSWQTIEALAASAGRTDDFGGVLAFLRTEAGRRPADRARLEDLIRSVLAVAEERADREAGTALVLERAGRFEAAIACWTKVENFGIPELADRARAAIATLRASDASRRHADALPALGPLLLKIEPLLREQRLEEAEDAILALARATPELAHECSWLVGTVHEARGIFGQVAEGMATMTGERVKLSSHPGLSFTVEACDRDGVRLLPPEGGALTVRWGDLPPDVFLTAALRGGATADYVGQFMLFTGRAAEGRRMWRHVAWKGQLDAIADQVEEAKRRAR
ncbi:MAG: hypothetical protein HUU15_17585, partial [Candidatus Brocadiae bacterium]|nr:hypothetical protein [Candidatus Brocadiia bacterium]